LEQEVKNVSSKRFKELKNLSKDELTTKVREIESELFQAKMKKTTGQLADSSMIWRLRKDVARLKTLMTMGPKAAK
jgi:large subunit ribosomal protein L29